MSERDVWGEDARTDRAIEHLRGFGARTDAEGRVVARHRYSRSFERVAGHLIDIHYGAQSESVRIVKEGGRVTVTISVVTRDGTEWVQEGTAGRDDDAYSWHALAACRALLDFEDEHGEKLSPDAVVALLEQERSDALAAKRRGVG